MNGSDNEDGFGLSRRTLLAAVGAGAVATMLRGTAEAAVAPDIRRSTEQRNLPPVHGLHLQFGADASSEVVASWHTRQSVRRPRVLVGRVGGKLERTAVAKETSYTDAKSGQQVFAYHARLRGLQPGSTYMYAAVHDDAEAEFGTFRTAPRGRRPFVFTSFGDQGTPTLGKKYVPEPGATIRNPPLVNDNLGSPSAGDTTLGVERVQPLFHVFNGDLCYANLAADRVRKLPSACRGSGPRRRSRRIVRLQHRLPVVPRDAIELRVVGFGAQIGVVTLVLQCIGVESRNGRVAHAVGIPATHSIDARHPP